MLLPLPLYSASRCSHMLQSLLSIPEHPFLNVQGYSLMSLFYLEGVFFLTLTYFYMYLLSLDLPDAFVAHATDISYPGY
jgi:hypothetical protein